MHSTDRTCAPARSGRVRIMAASGVLVAAGVLLSAATLADVADTLVTMDGSRSTFDILVAGSAAPEWSPVPADWQQGNVEALTITHFDGHGGGALLAPGGALAVRVAALNASPRVAATLSLTIVDPDPRSGGVDPVTGNRTELFGELVFTVRHGETVLLDRTPARDLSTYTWDSALPAGGSAVLDVTIEMPASLGNEWQLAATDVQFAFVAVNA
jgi:hypothetical protein